LYRRLIKPQGIDHTIFCLYDKNMKEKRGRPPVPESERRVQRFQIRLSEAEMGLLERAAKGRTSTWARKVLIAAANRQINSK
jgi:hypothetical protein